MPLVVATAKISVVTRQRFCSNCGWVVVTQKRWVVGDRATESIDFVVLAGGIQDGHPWRDDLDFASSRL